MWYKILVCLVLFVIGFGFGLLWERNSYNDKCLDLGGGKNPGGHSICVIDKTLL